MGVGGGCILVVICFGGPGAEAPGKILILRLFKPFGGLATSFWKRARRDLSVGGFSAPLGAITGLKQNVENQSVTPIGPPTL